jgi:CheY-like chemotaxis protein
VLGLSPERPILIGADGKMLRELWSDVIKQHFGSVCSAIDGYEILCKARECSARLVLVDYDMRVVNGIQAFKIIRKSSSYAETPMVLMADDNDLARVRIEIGVDSITRVLSKFSSTEQILDAVGDLLKHTMRRVLSNHASPQVR